MTIKTTKDIATFVTELKYSQLPSGIVTHIKDVFMGYVSSTLAGAVLPIGRVATDYARTQAASPAAGVWGGGFKTTLEAAAMANATISHATELEDVSFPDGLYTLAILAPVFAIAEHRKMSGKQLIEAFVAGYDVTSRLGVACKDAGSKGWLVSAVFASVGNAGAAAKLLGLNYDQTLNALSIGASQGTGLVRQAGMGAHTFEAGFAARNGICAANLAQLGLDGSATIIEGPGGMTDLIAGVPDFDLSGSFRVEQIGIRKYPCCGIMQRVIDGMSDLVAEEQLRKEDVDSIDVDVNHTFGMYVKYPEPVTAAQTRFSIEHAMAACFMEKRVFLNSFTDEAARDPQYKGFRKKVHVKMHPEWERGYFPQPTIITVRLKDGQSFKRDCVFARGDAGHPIAREDMKRKYDGGIAFNNILSPAAAKRAAELIEGIEDLKDISQLTDIFVFPDRAQTAAPERSRATQ